MKYVSQTIERLWSEEEGLGTLEIVLIVAVLVIIAIAFRKWIMKWLEDLFNKADAQITNQSGTIESDANTLSPKTP